MRRNLHESQPLDRGPIGNTKLWWLFYEYDPGRLPLKKLKQMDRVLILVD
jgi:hypothetical protein